MWILYASCKNTHKIRKHNLLQFERDIEHLNLVLVPAPYRLKILLRYWYQYWYVLQIILQWWYECVPVPVPVLVRMQFELTKWMNESMVRVPTTRRLWSYINYIRTWWYHSTGQMYWYWPKFDHIFNHMSLHNTTYRVDLLVTSVSHTPSNLSPNCVHEDMLQVTYTLNTYLRGHSLD
mgnify:CR=1 FL=1